MLRDCDNCLKIVKVEKTNWEKNWIFMLFDVFGYMQHYFPCACMTIKRKGNSILCLTFELFYFPLFNRTLNTLTFQNTSCHIMYKICGNGVQIRYLVNLVFVGHRVSWNDKFPVTKIRQLKNTKHMHHIIFSKLKTIFYRWSLNIFR